MAHDDEAPHPGSIDPAVARGNTSGSTPAPADGGEPADARDTDVHDDDALADALAAEYSWLATAAIPIVTQPEPGASNVSGEDWLSRMFDEPEPEPDATFEEEAEVEPTPVVETAPVFEAEPIFEPAPVVETAPVFEPTPVFEAAPAAETEPESESVPNHDPAFVGAEGSPVETGDGGTPLEVDEPDDQSIAVEPSTPDAPTEPVPPAEAPPTLSFVSPFDPPTASASIPDAAAAPWSLFPAPDPSQAVDLPDGPPQFFTPSDVRDWPAPSFDEPADNEPVFATGPAESEPVESEPGESEPATSGPVDQGSVDQGSAWQDRFEQEWAAGIVSSVPAWEQPQGQSTGEPLDPSTGDSASTGETAPTGEVPSIVDDPASVTDGQAGNSAPESVNDEPSSGETAADVASIDAETTEADPVDSEPIDSDPIEALTVEGAEIESAAPVVETPAPRREAPNAWTAWAPSPEAPSEWDAAAAVRTPPVPPAASPDAGVDPPMDDQSAPDSDTSDDGRDGVASASESPLVPEGSDPEPSVESPGATEPEPEPASEQFPWIIAAAAAAAAQPLVPPVDRDPFNWAITATGKVAYLDDKPDAGNAATEETAALRFQEPVVAEPVVADPVVAEPAVAETVPTNPDRAVPSPDSSEPESPEPTELRSEPEPEALVDDIDPPRMFAPPPLIEPLSPPQYPTPASGLPSAPPAYFPVGSVQDSGEATVSGSTLDPLFSDEEPPRVQTGDDSSAPAESMPVEPSPFDSLFVVPLPTVSGGPVPTTSGSITVIDQAYEEELDDDVDDTDRAFGALLSGGAAAAAPVSALAPPSGPISTVRLAEDEPVFFSDEPKNPGMFSLEHSALEPTPVDVRAGRAIRLFWLWFSANSSVVSLALGAVVFATGMSLRQSIVAILAGVALSFFPLALTTLAGKRSGQPTMVVSRATFGLLGNIAPAVLAAISRVFWGAVLLWVLATSVAAVAAIEGVATERESASLATLAIALVISLLVAFVGYPLLARLQLLLTVVSAVLVVGLIALTARYIDIPRALTVADGSWVLAVGGAVLVFSVVGLVWAFSGADLARYQRASSGGASSMLSATFGTAIPAFALIAYGAILSASSPGIASGLATDPMQTLAGLLPVWYPIPLIAATTLSLLSGVVITMYSGGLALQAIGVKLPRQWSVVVIGVLLGALATLMVVTVTSGIGEVFRDFATTLAVPTAAWIGIFGSEMMIRNRRFDSESLLRRGGVYGDVRWVNLVGLLSISVVGFGFTTATVGWLSWQGFGFSLLGVPLSGELASTDLGVIVALALGIMLPLVAGVPAIRRQESLRA